jgi:hypothetical protein
VSWTPPLPASSIKDNAQSGASLDFSVGCIYNSTHTACCLLLKTQVPRACHRYRPLDVRRASAFTVPSTCTRHSHVPEVTPPQTAGRGPQDDLLDIAVAAAWQGLGKFGPCSTAGSLPYFLPFSHYSVRKLYILSQFRRQQHKISISVRKL